MTWLDENKDKLTSGDFLEKTNELKDIYDKATAHDDDNLPAEFKIPGWYTPKEATQPNDAIAVTINPLHQNTSNVHGQGLRRSKKLKGGKHSVNDAYVRYSEYRMDSPNNKMTYNEWLKQDASTIQQNKQHDARIQEIKDEQQARQRQIDEWNAEMRRRRDSPFTPIVQGLTDVADFAVKNIANKVGVPKIVTEAYKAFAPPTSEFYQGEGLKNYIQNKINRL